MALNRAGTRLYVADSNADAVSVIDTARDAEIERIDVRLAEKAAPGSSPEALALDAAGARLYVANAHANTSRITGWMVLQPDVQYIVKPNGVLDDALAVGLRTLISF